MSMVRKDCRSKYVTISFMQWLSQPCRFKMGLYSFVASLEMLFKDGDGLCVIISPSFHPGNHFHTTAVIFGFWKGTSTANMRIKAKEDLDNDVVSSSAIQGF